MEIIIFIIAVLLSAAGGAAIMYHLLQAKLQSKQEIDYQTVEKNKELQNQQKTLNEQNVGILNSIHENESILQSLITRITDKENHLKDVKTQAEEAANIFYETNMNIVKERFDLALEQAGKEYQEAVDNFNQQLETVQTEKTLQFQQEVENNNLQLESLRQQLDHLTSTVKAAIEAAKREEEIKTAADFYRIHLSDTDIKEIETLRSVAPYLRNQEPLNKIIWKVYYEKPTTDLIGRVVGSTPCSGIYKITNIENKMCYIGQAANIADRWKQHIKRGVGADTPTRNKLYPAMIEIGPENFTFEVVEKCDRSALDAREDYWQDYFGAKEFGYSIK